MFDMKSFNWQTKRERDITNKVFCQWQLWNLNLNFKQKKIEIG
jgi:hypothetical protein